MLRSQVTLKIMQESQLLIDIFVKMLNDIYGEKALKPNFHFLQHLPFHAYYMGNFLAFVFESNISTLKRHVHGTRGFDNQLLKCYTQAKERVEEKLVCDLTRDFDNLPNSLQDQHVSCNIITALIRFLNGISLRF